MAKVNAISILRIIVTAMVLLSVVFSGISGAQASNVTNAICNVYFIVNDSVFILALTLMILGGAVYSGGQILPGSARGQIQAYAMGLVLGGTIGAIIAMLAPWLLGQIFGANSTAIATFCPGF